MSTRLRIALPGKPFYYKQVLLVPTLCVGTGDWTLLRPVVRRANRCGAWQTFTGHTRRISDMSWSPDGSMLVSASEDGTVIFWKVQQ